MPSFAISKFTVLLETLWVSSRIFAFVNRSENCTQIQHRFQLYQIERCYKHSAVRHIGNISVLNQTKQCLAQGRLPKPKFLLQTAIANRLAATQLALKNLIQNRLIGFITISRCILRQMSYRF